MSYEDTIHGFFETIWNQKKTEATSEIFAPDAIIHGSVSDFTGVDAIENMFRSWIHAFPDCQYKAIEIITSKDKASCRFQGIGTHKAPFLGVEGTGKKITHNGIEIFHFDASGKVKELWAFSNMLEIFKELTS